jgi:hypothetical protein
MLRAVALAWWDERALTLISLLLEYKDARPWSDECDSQVTTSTTSSPSGDT